MSVCHARTRFGIVDRTDSIGTSRMGAMRYRIQFLDGSANVTREFTADARNAVGAIALVTDIDWPPRAVAVRVLDADGREVHSEIRGESQR